jgi:hypothetical protein
MNPAARVLATAASMAMLIPICGFSPDAAQSAGAKIDADIIVTAAPVYEPLAALRGGERFPKGAQLLMVHAGKAEPLVTGFAASADANVSFDGKRILFAGKRAAGDPWQIWELTLENRSLRKLIAGEAMRFGRSTCLSGGWSTRGERRKDFTSKPPEWMLPLRLRKSTRMQDRRCFRSATCLPARFPRTCCWMDAFCLKPASRLARERRRSCSGLLGWLGR